MSKNNNNANNKIENNNLESILKSENYLSSLQNENSHLNIEIKKLNDIVLRLKSQISNYEVEKKNLITNTNKKENDLKDLKKKLIQTKNEVEELKKKLDSNKIVQKKDFEELKNQNDILQKNKNENQILLVQLQNKITDLEFQLKSKESQKNFFINPLKNDKNITLSISPSAKKFETNDRSYMQDIINDDETYHNLIKNKNNNIINNNDLFLTGKNELIEMKEINEKLNVELFELKKEIDLNKAEKDKLNLQLEKLKEEHNELLNILRKKNLEINNKLNQQSQLNNDLISQLNKNQQMKKNFENIKIKYSVLTRTKRELEDVIFLQENKVQELSSNVEKVSNIIKLKDKEIRDKKSYIHNLEDTIKKLNSEFKIFRNQKNKEAQKKINLLKLQISSLKKEYQNNEINNNSNFNINNNYYNISNKHSIINYRNNALNYRLNRDYVTSLTNEHSINTIDSSPKKIIEKGKNTPFALKKMPKKLKNIPIGNNSKKRLIKKASDIPFRHTPASINNKSLSVKKEKENNHPIVNILSKDNRYYNKSFKDLKNIDNADIMNNEDKKEEDKNLIIENGMSQSELNSSGKILKNVGDDKENNISNNLLINSQIDKKDKEIVNNFKLFLNKLIDDLDN